MIDKLCKLADEYQMLPAHSLILCAVSGGMDSMCLLHALNTLSHQRGFTLYAAHFNHHLRGQESMRDERFVRTWCSEHDIPLICGGGEVAERASQTGQGIEQTARTMRYDFLQATAKQLGAARIATAHTADDNAETVLFHLIRGAGLQGLSGISPRRDNLVRPLLNIERQEIIDYCARHSLPHVEDSSNFDETYTRNFLRHQVMPLLRQVNPQATQALSTAANRLRHDHEYICAQAAAEVEALALMTPDGLSVNALKLAALPYPVAVRSARLLLEQAGGGTNCTAAHLQSLLALCSSPNPSGQLSLPGLHVRRVYDQLILTPISVFGPTPPDLTLVAPGETRYGETGWTVSCQSIPCPEQAFESPNCFYLSRGKLSGSLTLRPRQAGDTIKLPGRGTKSVKKMFIDCKLPASERPFLPILADEAGVLAVATFGPEVSKLAHPGDAAIKVIFRRT